MAGLFCNHRVRSFMIVAFVIVTVQRIDGYPYQWPEFFSFTNTKQPLKESLNETDLSTSVSKDYERSRETVVSGQTIHYAESSLTYDDSKGESRVVETAQEKCTSGLNDDENNNSDFEKAKKNYNDDDNSDYDNNDDDDDNYDVIKELIENAIKDGIFLTREKFDEKMANKLLKISDDDEGTSVKKTRSPSESQNKVTQNTPANIGDRIVFPNEVQNGKLNDFTHRPVPSCENKNFCVDTPYYPSDSELDKALGKKYLEPVTEPSTVATRIGEGDEPDILCTSTEEVVAPKLAKNQNDEWAFIVNKENFKQTVRIEVCKTEDTACEIIDSLLTGYKTSCKQKYIYHKMVGIGSNGIESVPFRMPSSCCCHVKFTGDVMARIGIDVGKSNPQTPVPKGNNN